ncbi:MAG: protein-glutamate O-methyltransferase CheR, partial [Myxococcales bacterium]|nr:protein-glutamate O-methyltransferase CheR [Myxococcales bacterium]
GDHGGGRRLRIWSAGCSTGEEAYSLAMLVKESELFEGWDVEIVGTDLNAAAIERARAAVYGASSFRVLSDERRARYFEPLDDGWQVRDELRALCRFERHNLVDLESRPIGLGVDLVVCRNVLMYLSSEARLRIVSGFYDTLGPGGCLSLGHSESLLNLSTRFTLRHAERDLIYRRPSDDQP